VLGLGLTRTEAPLPFGSGCLALHDFLVTLPVVATPDNVLNVAFQLPDDPTIAGADVLSQYLALDVSMNGFGLAASERGSTRFQF
jgi:hypothetical protein